MAVSKRLRYEIFRRDNHSCRYCGSAAPDVKITIDHVVPVTLGGGDDPTNLVTACSDCNSGKTSTPVDAPLIAQVAADALRWSKAMQQASEVLDASRVERDRCRQRFLAAWDAITDGCCTELPADWGTSIDRFIAAGLDYEMAVEAIETTAGARWAADSFKYFCGIAWKMIAQKQEIARNILSTGEDH